jgi:hypothetical protein
MFKNRSIAGAIATAIAFAYGIYLISYWAGANTGTSGDSEAVGAAIATALVLPHLLVTWIGVIFGFIGFFTRKSGFLLTAAILYASAAVLFLIYAIFLVPSIVLGFIGYVNQKKMTPKKKK